jgi:hypothetical protein
VFLRASEHYAKAQEYPLYGETTKIAPLAHSSKQNAMATTTEAGAEAEAGEMEASHAEKVSRCLQMGESLLRFALAAQSPQVN